MIASSEYQLIPAREGGDTIALCSDLPHKLGAKATLIVTRGKALIELTTADARVCINGQPVVDVGTAHLGDKISFDDKDFFLMAPLQAVFTDVSEQTAWTF